MSNVIANGIPRSGFFGRTVPADGIAERSADALDINLGINAADIQKELGPDYATKTEPFVHFETRQGSWQNAPLAWDSSGKRIAGMVPFAPGDRLSSREVSFGLQTDSGKVWLQKEKDDLIPQAHIPLG